LGLQKLGIRNAEGNIDIKSKRFSNVGRLDSAIAMQNGNVLPFREDVFGSGKIQVAMQARYLMGAQFAEGEAEKHQGLGSLLPEQYELDSQAVGGLQVGQYYGSTDGLGFGGDVSG
ncbi:MAG TPA: hypothetical protein PLZ51_29520, partial [Aggregatilineales bacterium]|nr:hypothetical protein [Aggregatilineales bacterium]